MSNIAHIQRLWNWHHLVMKIRELPKEPVLSVLRPTRTMADVQPLPLRTKSVRNAFQTNHELDKNDLHPQDVRDEVARLNEVSLALHRLADEHVAMSDGLLRIAESVGNMATMLALFVVVKTS